MIVFAGTITLLLTVTVEARVGNSSEPTSFCTETEECLLYDLVCKGDEYEVRHYEASKWVTTDTESYFMEVAVFKSFRKLFKYITGENEQGAKIAMTAPVITKIKEDADMLEPAVYSLSFLLPSAYQKTAPKPTDSSVYFTDMPDMNVYVKSYGGWTIAITSTYYSHLLKKSLDNVQASYNKDHHYNVGYNSPMKVKDRHNEVWYIVEGNPVCPTSE
ncbi:heme-binding protein 2 [Hoplias malabaricus]|uniref:heme-binding protein 2 n=1 Tax=Hoplias malabaricus TaxID=27720 RepID=UPI00346358EF